MLPENQADAFGNGISIIIKNHQPERMNLTRDDQQALLELRKKEKMVITKADKGQSTVIFSKIDYRDRVKSHLAEGSYQVIENLRATTIMNNLKRVVSRYMRGIKENLGQSLCFMLYPKSTQAPRFCRLP